MPDSYDLLAKSIERVIRSDLTPPSSPATLSSSIDRIMSEEARAGEMRVGYLRVMLVAAFVVLALDATARRAAPYQHSLTIATASLVAAWLALSVALVLALRRGWYRHWLPHAMPVVDATAIAVGFTLPLYLGVRTGTVPSPDAIASLTALCAFLTLSGGLRLSRSSSRIGTVLGVIVFVAAALIVGLRVLPTAAVAVALLVSGMLSASLTALVRRLVTDEVAKATLSQMYKEATLAIEAREQVLKIVSHDLRNPLATIKMGASLLIDVDMEREQQREQLRRIQRAGERMNRLVHDLLDVAKLEAGRVAIVPRTIAVEPLLREAYEALLPQAAEHGITLELDVTDELPPVTADADRLHQVLANLVGNAIKFTPAGGRIGMRAHRVPEGVHFAISDTGPGIPAEQLERIFARFWQANAADRRGIGLGLTIAKGIMDAHGARLWAESRIGEGTTFHFVLGNEVDPASASRDRRALADAGTLTAPDAAVPAPATRP